MVSQIKKLHMFIWFNQRQNKYIKNCILRTLNLQMIQSGQDLVIPNVIFKFSVFIGIPLDELNVKVSAQIPPVIGCQCSFSVSQSGLS